MSITVDLKIDQEEENERLKGLLMLLEEGDELGIREYTAPETMSDEEFERISQCLSDEAKQWINKIWVAYIDNNNCNIDSNIDDNEQVSKLHVVDLYSQIDIPDRDINIVSNIKQYIDKIDAILDASCNASHQDETNMSNDIHLLTAQIIQRYGDNLVYYIDKYFKRIDPVTMNLIQKEIQHLVNNPLILNTILDRNSKDIINTNQNKSTCFKFLTCPENKNAANLFVELILGDVILYSDTGPLFVWDKNSKLWIVHKEISILVNIVSDTLVNFLESESVLDQQMTTSQARATNLNYKNLANNAIIKVGKASFISGVITFVKGMIKDHKFINKLDVRKDLLSIKGGKVVDLRTGEVLERTKEHYLTREIEVNYNPNAYSQVYDNFMNDIMLGNIEMINYLEDLLGYFITGETFLRSLYFFLGSGSNGKSTYLTLLRSVFGPYCNAVSKYCFIKKGKNGALIPEYEDLMGIRLAICSELERDDVLDSGGVKTMTGDDTTPFRLLYKGMTKLDAQFKGVIGTNTLPVMDANDYAIMTRAEIVDFKAHYYVNDDDELITSMSKKVDPSMKDKLHTDAVREYILRIAVERAIVLYRDRKIHVPVQSKLTKNKLKHSSEKVYIFLKEEVVTGNVKFRCGVTELYETYKEYCYNLGQTKPLSMDDFGNHVLRIQGTDKIKSSIMKYTGIKIGVPCPHGDSEADCVTCLLARVKAK
jgi:P4 family phage/plasmid primase-like protien